MTLVEMDAWSTTLPVQLSHSQAGEIASLDLVDVRAHGSGDRWTLAASSRIGVAVGNGWELRVRPRLSVPKLFFLLAYAADPKGWRDQIAEFEPAPDLLDAVANGFSWHALVALKRGLLRGYVNIDERLTTIRGRVRFGDQIARSASLPVPVEVSYSDYTEDVLENQMLRTATLVLLGLRRVPIRARKRLLKLRGLLDAVGLVERPREARMPLLTRLNDRYGNSLRLAELILHASSIDAAKGRLAVSAFIFDMNKVFEDFVTIALQEALRSYGGVVKAQWEGWLDRERHLEIRPDITWWEGTNCLAVADAKYKELRFKSMPNGDVYQMLAYCTALNVEHGFLVYAKDAGQHPQNHAVLNSPSMIEVRTLDVETEPEQLLAQVQVLAAEIVASVSSKAA